jgi:hypothetical protein
MAKEEELIALSRPGYWDERYTSEQKLAQDSTEQEFGSYEWFRNFEKLQPFFEEHLPHPPNACHILHLGCGSSVSLILSYRPTMPLKPKVSKTDMHLVIDLDSGSSLPWLLESDECGLLSSSH